MNNSEKLSAVLEFIKTGLLTKEECLKILEIPMSFKFEVDDDVKIIDQWSNHAGQIGTVVSRFVNGLGYNVYQLDIPNCFNYVEYEEGQLRIWTNASQKYSTRLSIPANPYVYVGTDFKAEYRKSSPRCMHTWKEDFANPFSTNRYFSCPSCGKKKEDYEAEIKIDDGVPF